MKILVPNYCSQNFGICHSCPLMHEARDCQGNRIEYTLTECAKAITGGDRRRMVKLLLENSIWDYEDPRSLLDRWMLVSLANRLAGDEVGRRCAELLKK